MTYKRIYDAGGYFAFDVKTCPTCKGTGRTKTRLKLCKTCGGSGKRTVSKKS